MSNRYALVGLWLVFAAAAVGVGFAAAGLVDAPFASGTDPPLGRPLAGTATSSTATPSVSPTSSQSPSSSSPRSSSPSSPSGAVKARGITTRGGYVQARCSGSLVTVSASPAVGWWLERRSSGAVSIGEVRFRRTGGDAEVRLEVACTADGPRFSVREDDHGGSGEGGSDTSTSGSDG